MHLSVIAAGQGVEVEVVAAVVVEVADPQKSCIESIGILNLVNLPVFIVVVNRTCL